MTSRAKIYSFSISGWVLSLGSQPGWHLLSVAFFQKHVPLELLSSQADSSLNCCKWSVVGKYSHSFLAGISKYNIAFHISAYFYLPIPSLSLASTPFINLNICPALPRDFRCYLMPWLHWISQLASVSLKCFIYKIAYTYHIGH